MYLSRLGNTLCKSIYKKEFLKRFRSSHCILGIETSCDDTGCAIIDESGELLAETLHSQSQIHLRYGGIIPDIAQDLHRANIERVVSQTLDTAKMTLDEISAIAVTVEPGLPLSLAIGKKYAKHLARKYRKPIIPIHHMEAHALAVRMEQEVEFPYLVLLISGGHCLLAVVNNVNDFKLLGESIDCAPGEVFDKVARTMQLKDIPEYSKMCGGEAVETAAAKATNAHSYKLPLALAEMKDCNFSFNGLKTSVENKYRKVRYNTNESCNLEAERNNVCAALLAAVSRHLVHRTQRAMEYCKLVNLIPRTQKKLVVSGGVACNDFIYNSLQKLCNEFEYTIYRPARKLCTDNGVMIAWNGIEKWRRNIDVLTNFDNLDIKAVSPLGESLISDVVKANLRVKLIKLHL